MGRSRPWIFHGRPAATTDATSYCYEIEGSEGKQKFLRITVHHKQRKQDDGTIQSLPSHWWDAEREVSPTLRYSPEVAPTLVDTQMEDTQSTSSPLKKKSRTDASQPRLGPGGFELKDMGGQGDCGYRCIAYGVA